jgi:hypothetical protein
MESPSDDADTAQTPVFVVDPDLAARIDSAMRQWQQGFVVGPGLLVWLADREQPLTSQTAQEGGTGVGLTKAKAAHEYLAVVTQTCDIFKSCSSTGDDDEAWPFVQLCPVVKLKGAAVRGEAAGGHHSRFAPLPALGEGDCFADLNQCVTVEKAILLGLDDPKDGCRNDVDRLLFADVVARNRGRFAFPDGVNEIMKPLRRRFREKGARDSPEGRRIQDILEVRLRRSPTTQWTDSPVLVEIIYVIKSESLSEFTENDDGSHISADLTTWLSTPRSVHQLSERLDSATTNADRTHLWNRLVQEWHMKAETSNEVIVTGVAAESAADYSIERARSEPKLDYDHLSFG